MIEAVAAPSNNSQQSIQLAMLELNKLDKSIKPRQSPKIAVTYHRDCMKWTAKQINRKSQKYASSINKYSRKYRIDSNLVKSIITAESCFKKRALSKANAQGLMQLIPATAKRFGVKNSYNTAQNIRGGTQYLRFLLDRFEGDLKKTIAAYNAGEGNVDKYNGVPPFKETKLYLKNVLATYQLLSPQSVRRVKAVYYPPKMGNKPGRHGWQYNRQLAPQLYKKIR